MEPKKPEAILKRSLSISTKGDDIKSYYQLVLATSKNSNPPSLSQHLQSFITFMSKGLMDFYNRFPKGSPMPDRRVTLPKRDPKSTLLSDKKNIRSSLIWTRL
jgi:hypothetical protein